MRGRRRIGVDSEGYLIGKANKTPKTVCVTVCCDDGEAEIFKWSEARDLLFDILNTPSLELVLHHARFDLASFAAMDPELLALVFKAYDEDRIRCTMIREKLLALAKGELADEGDTGAKRNRKFSLAAIVLERFHVDLSGDKSSAKENKDGTYTLSGNKASWRLRYSELDNVPLRDWPEDAKKYALDDPRWNLAVYESQEAELVAGGGSELDGVIPDEMYQTRAAFWLYLMSAWGIRTDPVAVNALSSKLEAEWARINTVVRAGDVLKPQMKKGEMVWTKNMTAIRERVVSAFGGLENLPLSAWTPGGKDGKGKKEVSTSGETLLACVNRPCLDWIEERERAVVELRVKEALPPLSEEALTSLAKTLCHSAADEFYPPEETYVDTQGGAPPPRERRVESRSAVADRIFNQIILDALSERGNTEKLLKTYVPMLFDGTQRPICANTNELVATGRTSSWDPNLQNPPRKGGVRECFVPRRGKLFAFCDYSFIELVTLAQVCLWKFGYSVLGDSINAGRDPHLVMAATMLGTTYEEVHKRRKDPDIKTARQNAKCFHPDTEALTRKGWKRIGDLVPGEEVAAAVPYEGGHVEILWEVPTNLSRRQTTDLVHLKNKGIDLRVTPEHRMLSFSLTASGRGRRCVGDPPPRIGSYKVITPEEMPRARYFPSAGILDNENGGVEVDERLLRLAVATQADGSYTDSGLVRFGFTKQRKIDRLRGLLHGGECFESVSSQGVPTFKFGNTLSTKVRSLLDEDKTVPWWWLNLTPRLRGIVLEEMEHWDCYTADHTEKGKNTKLNAVLFSTTLRKNADVLQAIGVLSGRKSRLRSVSPATDVKAESFQLSLKDHHLTRGGQMEATRTPYEGEVVCLSVPSTFVVVRDRGLPVITGQCVNFGRPGGLGDDKFVEYAYATYGVRMTKAEARRYKELWFETYPEMREYLAFFGKMSLGDREFTITQLPSGRVRGGCRYTSGANSLFQGLAADGIKRAGWHVSKECYLSDPYFDDVGPTALFGSRIVAMLHDELILEVPEEKAHEATERLSERMISGMHEVVPDIKVGTEAALARRWYKGAEPVFVDGRLVPWSPKEVVVVEKEVSTEALSWAREYIGMDT